MYNDIFPRKSKGFIDNNAKIGLHVIESQRNNGNTINISMRRLIIRCSLVSRLLCTSIINIRIMIRSIITLIVLFRDLDIEWEE